MGSPRKQCQNNVAAAVVIAAVVVVAVAADAIVVVVIVVVPVVVVVIEVVILVANVFVCFCRHRCFCWAGLVDLFGLVGRLVGCFIG